MKVISNIAVAVGLVVSTINFASAENSYFETSYSLINYSEPGLSAKPTALRGIYGVKTSDSLAYEGMLGLGLASSTTSYANIKFDIKMTSMIGVYAKGTTKLSDSVEAFGRFGLTHLNDSANATYNGKSTSFSSNGGSLSYGAGLKFNMSKDYDFVVDYMSYYNKDSVKFTGTSLGVSVKF